ncbi:hypothetical protein ACOME3_000226 [Neoechinorhynchus agilis]
MARKIFVRSREKQTQDLNKHQRSSGVQPNRKSSNTVNADRAQQQNSRDYKICVMCKINQSSRWQKLGELLICKKCIDLCTFSVMARLANIQAAAGRHTSASLRAAQTNAVANIKTQQANDELSCHLCAENITEGTSLHFGIEICEICYSFSLKAIEGPLNTAPMAEASPKQSRVEPPHPANDSRLNQLIEMMYSRSIVLEPGIAQSSSMYNSDLFGRQNLNHHEPEERNNLTI